MRGLILLLALALPAGGAVIEGSDYAGADLIPANGDTLQGTFTNVGLFEVGPGTTVFLTQGVSLAVYASTVSIRGVLNGSDSGRRGGDGGTGGAGGMGGSGGGPSDEGGGGGGPSAMGGGGGGHAGAGGDGSGATGGSGGAAYGAADVVTSPISADDASLGSGGGGGGSASGKDGGGGGSGGGSVYLEASSMTVGGAIRANGKKGGDSVNDLAAPHPGGGGGGGGGGILLRVAGVLSLEAGSSLAASGGAGGDALALNGGTVRPGGGGGGGRIKVFYRTQDSFAVALTTGGGAAGGNGGFIGAVDGTDPPAAGAEGTVRFGVVASSPTAFGAGAVYVSSILWTWSASMDWGDGTGSRLFRVFPSTSRAPLPAPMVTAGELALGATEPALTPNTTYSRYVTAFTDWGDGPPSLFVTTHTLASVPGAGAFSGVTDSGLTVAWNDGSPDNPGYTGYELVRSLAQDFSASVSTSFIVGLSSSPAGLGPNTTYYFRARAVNLSGVRTAFTATMATATLAETPASPETLAAFISSAAFSWSGGANPAGTLYHAQLSTDNFSTVNESSVTLAASATFFSLVTGTQYFFRVAGRNHNGVDSAFSAVISTRAGSSSDPNAPTAPGAPQPDRQFSYDGAAAFSWTASQASAGVLGYCLEIGSTPGGNDFLAEAAPCNQAALSRSVAGLLSGRTYYARARAQTNAGILGQFSEPGPGVTVFITASESAFAKPINWPNPFDPAQGSTQIGFFLEEPADVTLKLYTLQGELVWETSRRYGAAGNQVLEWTGDNGAGSRVAPGGYIGVVEKRYSGRTDRQRLKIAVLY